MDISKTHQDETLELKITGRLDGYWANHLASVLEEEIRHGSHHVLLDLSGVTFLSSAGIGVLVRFYKELESLTGSFGIQRASDHVWKILEISALRGVLSAKPAGSVEDTIRDVAPPVAMVQEPPVISKPVARITRPDAIYEVHHLSKAARLTCRVAGDPSLLCGRGYNENDTRALHFDESSFAIGLGALGERFEDCRNRYGEFIAAASTVAYLPTDGTNVPDYFVSAGRSGSAVDVCYCIECEGPAPQPFAHLVRFEMEKDAGPVSFAQILKTCLEIEESDRIGLVMVAESAGLVGAMLRASPVNGSAGREPFQFPGIRQWLTFTAERAFARSVALVAGIANKGDAGELAPLVRPLGAASDDPGAPLAGHFHAAAFSYRPLRKGEISYKDTVKTLFVRQALEGVLHLLNDDREIAGAGESEFVRGACWVAPIKQPSRPGASQ